MTRFTRIALSRHIVVSAFKIAAAVGTALNLINQGENMLHGGTISSLHLLLNYLVPYCVASYSAAKNEIELRETNDCQLKPPGANRTDHESAG
jgi:hypothetical protein